MRVLHSASLTTLLQTCSVLGAVVGGDEVEERQRSARETALHDVDGQLLCCYYPVCLVHWYVSLKA